MKKIGNCPTGDAIRTMVYERRLGSNETVLVVSSAIPTLAMQQLALFASDEEGLKVVSITEEEGLGTDDGLNLDSEVNHTDELFLRAESLMNFKLTHDALPDDFFTRLPYWEQVNVHPRGPGPGQRKGGQRLHAHKRKR